MTLQEQLLQNASLLAQLGGPRIYVNRLADRPYPFIWIEGGIIHLYTKDKDQASLIAETILDDMIESGRSIADATLQRHQGRLFEATIRVDPWYPSPSAR